MPKLLHTPEELSKLNKLWTKACEVKKLADRYNDLLLDAYSTVTKKEVQAELDKYNDYIGVKASRPKDNFMYANDRPGTIEAISHILHNDIVVKFKYDNNGFDTVRLSELID